MGYGDRSTAIPGMREVIEVKMSSGSWIWTEDGVILVASGEDEWRKMLTQARPGRPSDDVDAISSSVVHTRREVVVGVAVRLGVRRGLVGQSFVGSWV